MKYWTGSAAMKPYLKTQNVHVMEQALTLKALVLQAEKDSLVVSEEELESLLDNQVRGFIQAYGSKEALEQIAGRTVYQIKEDFRVSFKERKLAELMRNKIVDGIKITPTEVKAFLTKYHRTTWFTSKAK